MPYIRSAQQYLGQAIGLLQQAHQATQIYGYVASREQVSEIVKRQEDMVARCLKKVIELSNVALERMGRTDIQEDDGSFS
jgi:hypothetical protein